MAASGMILKPMIIWWNFICLLILISFQFELYMIIINLVKVNQLIYFISGKTPKMKRIFVYLFSNKKKLIDNESFEGIEIAEHI